MDWYGRTQDECPGGGGLLFTEAPATRPLQRWEPSSWGRYPNPRNTKPVVRLSHAVPPSPEVQHVKMGSLVYLWFSLQNICFPCSPPSLMTLWLCLPHVLLARPSLSQGFVVTHVSAVHFRAHGSAQDSPCYGKELSVGPSTSTAVTPLRDNSVYFPPRGQQVPWEALWGRGGSDVSWGNAITEH